MDLTPSQEAALHQLAAIPGVVGGMVFDRAGEVIAAGFPDVFEPGGLKALAVQLAGDAYFAEWLTGERAVLDFRFGDGHVVIKPVDERWLLVLCTPQTNRQLLAMSLTQVVRRLRPDAAPSKTAAHSEPPPLPPAASHPGPRDRLRALAAEALGAHAAPALEILAACDDTPPALARAADEVARLTRLFISKKQAEELGRRMRETLGASA